MDFACFFIACIKFDHAAFLRFLIQKKRGLKLEKAGKELPFKTGWYCLFFMSYSCRRKSFGLPVEPFHL